MSQESQKINFENNAPVKRYLNDMSIFWNERREAMLPSQIQYADPLEIKTYLEHENVNENTEKNRGLFIQWLAEQNAIEYLHSLSEVNTGRQISENESIGFPETFLIHVRDIRPILKLQELLSEEVGSPRRADVSALENRYFSVDDSGDFFWGDKGKKNKIKFKNHDSLNYKVFEALCILGSNTSNAVSFSDIDRHLVLRGEEDLPTYEEKKKRISGAINNTLRRKCKKLNLPLKIKGDEVISSVRSKGYRFLNPLLN